MFLCVHLKSLTLRPWLEFLTKSLKLVGIIVTKLQLSLPLLDEVEVVGGRQVFVFLC